MNRTVSPPCLRTFLDGIKEGSLQKLEATLAHGVIMTIRSFRADTRSSVIHIHGRKGVFIFFSTNISDFQDRDIRVLEISKYRAALEWGGKKVDDQVVSLNYTLLLESDEQLIIRIALTKDT